MAFKSISQGKQQNDNNVSQTTHYVPDIALEYWNTLSHLIFTTFQFGSLRQIAPTELTKK